MTRNFPDLPHPALTGLLTVGLASLLGLAGSRAEAACDTVSPPLANAGEVVCTGADSTGFDGSAFTGLLITTSGVTVLDETAGGLDSALRLSNDNTVTIGTAGEDPADATINITQAGGFGIRAVDGNTITNNSTINVAQAGSTGISVGDDNTITLGGNSTINVTGDNAFGVEGVNGNTIRNEGNITVEAADGTAIRVNDGIDLPPPTDPDAPIIQGPIVTNAGTIILNGANSVGIESNNNHEITNLLGGDIHVTATATDGVGIRGADDNFVRNQGTITVDAVNGRAVVIGRNTGEALPNGAIFDGSSVVTINGNGGIGLDLSIGQVGSINSGILTLDLNAQNTTGILVGDKGDINAQANHTNSGTINVDAQQSFGMRLGDEWVDRNFVDDDSDDSTPEVLQLGSGIRNTATINVNGAQSFGVLAGNATNTSGNHNSFLFNSGLINVTGLNAVGASLGGNDLLRPIDPDNPEPTDRLFTFVNSQGSQNVFGQPTPGGQIIGGADAGPLLEITSFVEGFENRILNPFGGRLRADLTNEIVADRAVAFRGSAGRDVFINGGDIRGKVELLDGDDQFIVDAGHTLEGTVFGGDQVDEDEVLLNFAPDTTRSFDVSSVTGFERLQILGTDNSDVTKGWSILNANSFTGITEIVENGRLNVFTDTSGAPDTADRTLPITLGGDLVVDPLGSIHIVADGISTPITVAGDAAFDGEIIIDRSPLLVNAGNYQLIQVDGSTNASQFATETFDATVGLFSFSTIYATDGLSLQIEQSGTLAGVAAGANRTAIGNHLDAINLDMTGASDLQDEITSLFSNAANLNDVYDALSPEAYDAQTTLIADSHQRIANLLFERNRDCDPGALDPWKEVHQPVPCHARRWSPWLASLGTFRKRDSFGEHPDYNAKMGGLIFGVDVQPIADLKLTFAVASQRGQVDVGHSGESDLLLVNVSGYAAWSRGGLRAQSTVSYGYGSHNSRRDIRFQSNDSSTPVALRSEDDHESQHVSAAAEVGYIFSLGPFEVEPLVGADWVYIDQDSIGEGNAGSFGLRIDDRDDYVASVNAGLRLSTVYQHEKYVMQGLDWLDGVWRPTVDLRWRQTVSGYDRSLSARLNGSPDTVSGFDTDGSEDQGGFEIGAGLSFSPKHANRLQIDLQYDAFRSSHTVAHNLVAKFRLGF
jgi:uncharacterized protein with beta-barrel porin domain